MKPRGHAHLLLIAFAGCASAGDASAPGGKSDASGGWGGATGAGGNSLSLDAAAAFDGRRDQVPVNLASDAPVFDWDARTCNGCNLGGAAGGGPGGSTGGGQDAPTSGTGGDGGPALGGRTSLGGALGSGGVYGRGGAAGTAGRGGTTGTGGTPGGGGVSGVGGSRADAGVPADTRPVDASSFDGATRDLIGTPDLGAADLPPPGDAGSRCVVRIRSLVPATDDLTRFPLVAGDTVRLVARVEVLSGGPAAPVWSWQGYRESTPLPTTPGKADPAAAAFSVSQAGTYTLHVRDNTTCASSVSFVAVPADSCPGCDQTAILRAAPPPASSVPVQTGAIRLEGTAPFVQDFKLLDGVPVAISPSVGSSLISAYVRINSAGGGLVADGLADPKAAFGALLIDLYEGVLLKYDVLVVPINGTAGGTVAATAPQLFGELTPGQINSAGFALSGGHPVRGRVAGASGVGVMDARVILTNRNPALAKQTDDLIFSSVGRTDTNGDFVLYAQPGQYWVSVSPPAGSGLAEALAPEPVMLSGEATVSFQWAPFPMATLTLQVVDAAGSLVEGARVRLTSAETAAVGNLTVAGAGGGSQPALGNVRTEATTVGGVATFASLPAGVVYQALIVPPALGPFAATTAVTVDVPAGGAVHAVQLAAQGRIEGNLVVGGANPTPDWSLVNLVAYDRSTDTPEPPRAFSANPDGSFALGVSPGRAYVVLVVPDASTKLGRTFVGPGWLQATEFPLTQRVPVARHWTARVLDQRQRGLEGTALQVFCEASWPGCIDATVPLAETTAEYGGVFDLALPDPATR